MTLQKNITNTFGKFALIALVALSLPACSPSHGNSANLVAEAYETAGIVAVAPYEDNFSNIVNF